MIDALATPFQYEFFRSGTIAAVLVGALCGLIGVYIVLRGMSYIGHGLAHAIFGGAVVAFVLQFNFYVGAGIWGFLAALLINQTARRTRINADAAIGVVTTASFAIGVILISRYRRFTQSFDAALFGNILGVTTTDVLVVAAVTALVTIIILLLYKQLLFTTFDSEVAGVYGVSTGWIETWFALVLAAAIIASIQILGVTMIADHHVHDAGSIDRAVGHVSKFLCGRFQRGDYRACAGISFRSGLDRDGPASWRPPPGHAPLGG
jgi:manganese/iron transport system permease protein/iron/zinc/copper transport system permease protein